MLELSEPHPCIPVSQLLLTGRHDEPKLKAIYIYLLELELCKAICMLVVKHNLFIFINYGTAKWHLKNIPYD